MIVAALLGCGGDLLPRPLLPPVLPGDSGGIDSAVEPPPGPFVVEVRLDGVPAAATVYVGGDPVPRPTDAAGRLSIASAPSGVVLASHPAARTEATTVDGDLVVVDLETIHPADNPAYVFQDPGSPDDAANTSKCAHCHVTIAADWFASPHARAASNPVVHDVYAGAAIALADPVSCAAAGGRWWTGIGPGTGAPADRCYLGSGTLPDLDPTCGLTGACDGVAARTGGCADCHAPGLDGVLGGRDLLEATGLAYTYGVHCDVCHKVEAVDLTQPPGVAGALRIHRPSEPDGGLFDWRPLTFGPYDDVGHVRMGAAYREVFHQAELCAGCHELRQEVLVPGAVADLARWPDGRLPIHTTFSEWSDGPISPTAPCQSCHMPPDPLAGNSADLGNVFALEEGIAAGWYRPPGSVRRHTWPGPRQPDLGLLGVAAAVDLATTVADGVLTVEATVTNAGAGHAIPTGEPLRALLLRVEATCDGAPLAPTGGDVLPDWAGALDAQPPGDWTRWPGASVGDRIRVIARPGGFHDVPGWGPFGDGTFDPVEKGLPVEVWAGEATVTAVDGDQVTLDRPLPPGDLAYRVPALGSPQDGDPVGPLAGAPGFAFARVLVDADGAPMVPHHRAVDVRSDDRLMPQARWTSTHTFASPCAGPVARAVVVHRPLPYALAAERRWVVTDAVIAEATR